MQIYNNIDNNNTENNIVTSTLTIFKYFVNIFKRFILIKILLVKN